MKFILFLLSLCTFMRAGAEGILIAQNISSKEKARELRKTATTTTFDTDDVNLNGLSGFSTYENNGNKIKVPFESIQKRWLGSTFETSYLGVLRAEVNFLGMITLLPDTTIKSSENFKQPKNVVKTFILEKGYIRVKTAPDFYFKNFKLYKAIIKTKLGKVYVTQNSDVYIYLGKDSSGKQTLKVQNVLGDVDFERPGEAQKIAVPIAYFMMLTGLGGKTSSSPVVVKEIERLHDMTLLTAEVDSERRAARERLSNLEESCIKYLKNKDYFSILEMLDPVTYKVVQKASLSFCYASAKQALSQFSDAERFYKRVLELDPEHGDAMWGLGLSLNMLKNYTESIKYLQMAKEKLDSNDPRLNDYDYYMGVGYYFKNEMLKAKFHFEDLVWNRSANEKLKVSARKFLSEILVDKNISLFALASFEYDSNILDEPDNSEIHNIFSQKWGLRSTFLANADYVGSNDTLDSGFFPGVSLTGTYLKNWTQEYDDLDTFLFQSKISLLHRSEKKRTQKEFINGVYGTGGIIYTNMNFDTYFMGFGGHFMWFDVSAVANMDTETKDSNSNMTLAQKYKQSFPLNFFKLSLNISAGLSQTFYFEHFAFQPDFYQAELTSSVTRPFWGLLMPELSLSFMPKYENDSEGTFSYRLIPQLSVMILATRHFFFGASGVIEFDQKPTNGDSIFQPGGGVRVIATY